MTLPTMTEYRTLLSAAELGLVRSRDALTTATKAFQTANDPAVHFTTEERDYRIGQALPSVLTAEVAAAEAVTTALNLSEQALRDTENPTPTLSPSDETLAAARAVFVREDVSGMTTGALVSRIRQAAVEGDRVSLFLYARYAKARLSGGDPTGTDDGRPRDPGTVPFTDNGSEAVGRADLSALVREIGESFRSPDMKALHDRATTVRADAFALERDASKRRNADRLFSFQSARDVAW